MRARKKTHDVILGAGIFLIIAGVALLSCFALKVQSDMLIAIPVIIIIAGAGFLFASYAKEKHVWQLFLGYFLTLGGLFSLGISFTTIDGVEFKRFWPILVILCGVCYGVASFQIKKKLYVSVLVPSVMLVALGGMFLGFSLTGVSFRRFVSSWWPVFLVLLGIILIIVYVYMQHSKAEDSTYKVIADGDDDD